MVTSLTSLHFTGGTSPSMNEQERVVTALAAILTKAATLGRTYAEEMLTRSIAWGSGSSNPLTSAWNIVTHFVARIKDWFTGQDGEDVSEEDVEAEVESLAETVADVEVHSAIEQAVMDTLQEQGVLSVLWIAQDTACSLCQDNADVGSMPIGSSWPDGSDNPPAHAHCRCNVVPAE